MNNPSNTANSNSQRQQTQKDQPSNLNPKVPNISNFNPNRKIMTPSSKSSFMMTNNFGIKNLQVQPKQGSIPRVNKINSFGNVTTQPNSTHKFPVRNRQNTHGINNIQINRDNALAHGKKKNNPNFSNNLSDQDFNTIPPTSSIPTPSNAHDIPQIPSYSKRKRKFTEIQKEKEAAKKEIENLLEELSQLYNDYVDGKFIERDEDFISSFEFMLNRQEFLNDSGKLLNFHRLLPESLNLKGSCLLENSKFCILYSKYKSLTNGLSSGIKTELSLDEFLHLIDNFLMYDLNDLRLIYHFFIDYVDKNFKKEEIHSRLNKNGYEANINDGKMKRSSFIYLLNNPGILWKYSNEEEDKEGSISQVGRHFPNNKPEGDSSIFRKKIKFNSDKKFSPEKQPVEDINFIKDDTPLLNSHTDVYNKNPNNKDIKCEIIEENPSEEQKSQIEGQIDPNINFINSDAINNTIAANNSSTRSNFVDLTKLSPDALIYYNEMVLRNKIDLTIEKSQISIKAPQHKDRKSYRSTSQEKFSIVKEVKFKESDIKADEDILQSGTSNNSHIRGRKSKNDSESGNSEEERDINTKEKAKSKTKNKSKVKGLSKTKKKKYQSDNKLKKDESYGEEENDANQNINDSSIESEREEKTKKNKKTKKIFGKNKKSEKTERSDSPQNKRGRSKSILSRSSAKESLNEEDDSQSEEKVVPIKSKKSAANNNQVKSKSRSKTKEKKTKHNKKIKNK